MKVLFDQGVPVPLRPHLVDHVVETVYELGWSTLSNGDLISQAEQSEFEIFITTDQKLRYQQNLSQRKLAIVVLMSASWPRIQLHIDAVECAISTAAAGSFIEVGRVVGTWITNFGPMDRRPPVLGQFGDPFHRQVHVNDQ